MPAAWAAAAAAVVGAVVQSNSTKKASAAQQQSAREANEVNKTVADQQVALQREMFNKTNELQQPALNDGATARNELMHYLGLTSQNTPVAAAPAQLTREQIRAQLSPQFTTAADPAIGRAPVRLQGRLGEMDRYGGSGQQLFTNGPGGVNEAALNAAVEARMTQQAQAQAAYTQAQTARANDPTFGEGSRNFGMDSFQQDPGYQFRMSEGLKGLERSASARGGLMSGGAAKDAMRFSQDLGSQEYMAAFNRFQTNRANKLNPLQSLMGAGQTAAGTIGTAGQNMANSTTNALGQYSNNAQSNITGAGNARASGYLAQGQAWANAANSIGGAVGSYYGGGK